MDMLCWYVEGSLLWKVLKEYKILFFGCYFDEDVEEGLVI